MNQKTATASQNSGIHRKSAATREKLLRTAEALFVERGYDAVSIRDVTARAGATKGHVYYYFKSKQDLFDTILDRYFAAHAEALMGAVRPEGPLRERLHDAVDAYLDFVEDHPGFQRLIQRESCTRSPNSDKIARNMEPLFRRGSEFLAGRLPADGPLSVRHFFISFFGMVINFYTYSPLLEHLWGYDPTTPSGMAERREHLHLVLDGLLDKFLADPEVEE